MLTRLTLPLLLVSLALLVPACGHDNEARAAPSEASKAATLDAEGFPEGPLPDRDPALAKELVDKGAPILDVRSAREFAAGHVPGAINIPHTQVPTRLDEIRDLVGGDLHEPVVVYCRSGRRSGIAKQDLVEAGFDRVTNLGGLSDWPG